MLRELQRELLREATDRELRGDVVRDARAGAAHARPRREVHDHSAPARVDHAARRFPAADERAPQVHVEHVLPVVVGELEDGSRGVDAHVVDPDVDPAESATAASAVSVIDAVSVTSSRLAIAVPPYIAASSSAVADAPGWSRSPINTDAPASARRRAIARPSPPRATGDDHVPSRQGDQLAEGRVAQIRDGHVRSIARPPPDQQASNVASNLRQ